FRSPMRASALKFRNARTSVKNSQSSSWPKAQERKTATSLLRARIPKQARRDSAELARLLAQKLRSVRVRNRAHAFLASFSAVAHEPHLTARFVQSSAQQRWNSWPQGTSEKWLRSTGRRSTRSKSVTPSASRKRCVPMGILFAPRVPCPFVSETSRQRIGTHGFRTFIGRRRSG